MDWILLHAGHLIPLLGLGAWLGWGRMARARAARAAQSLGAGPRNAGTEYGLATAATAATAATGTTATTAAAGTVPASLDARLALMACSVGAAVVHADVIDSHFRASILYGWFFALSAVAQLVWGLLVVRRLDRALLVSGAVGNAMIVALWAVTRTSGLPIGPTPGRAEAVGAFDVLATLLELALVIGAVTLLAGTRRVRQSRPKYNSRRTSRMLVNLRLDSDSQQNSASRSGGLQPIADERHSVLAGPHRGRRGGRPSESRGVRPTVNWILDYLPRGNLLDRPEWQKRHSFLQWILLIHLPSLFVFGVVLHHTAEVTALTLLPPLLCLLAGHFTTRQRLSSLFITAGLVYCSAALVGLSRGSIEAHFHFFIMIGFIALYQDWLPFLWNIAFTVLSHGVGTVWSRNLIFNHQAGEASPWVWSSIHGAAVLAACIGVMVFWRTTEDEQEKSVRLTRKLADAEIGRRKFTSDMLVNLARRNQSLLYRQLGIINQLEEQERDPDALAELFRLDHLATRIRRNAESLLVLSGEGPPRTWSEPVLLLDVVRAAIAETEDLDRVAFYLDERLTVMGHTVTDLTHLLAELVENAVRFSPPDASVIIRLRPHPTSPGAHVMTIEDCGIGMRPEDLDAANAALAHPQEVDLSVSQLLGLHVVARLAERHRIAVSLSPNPGSGITAVVVLPENLFGDMPLQAPGPISQHAMTAAAAVPLTVRAGATPAAPESPRIAASSHHGGPVRSRDLDGPSFEQAHDFGLGDDEPWSGWWEPVLAAASEEPANGDHPTASIANGPPEPAAPAVPVHAPRSQSSAPDAPPAEPLLTRRVPQSHLAPELRDQPLTAQPEERPVPDGDRTREALSRYQASRRAARVLVEREDAGFDDIDPPEGGGGPS
jgi:signal transduction histidine kinase